MSAQINSMNGILADYHIYYQKLRNYHWNVKGVEFFALHKMFEELYDEVSERIDEIAERILSSGGKPVSTLKEYLEIASLKEDAGSPDSKQMVKNIIGDLTAINASLRKAVEQANDAGDIGAANLLEGYADEQEKTLWMLNAFMA